MVDLKLPERFWLTNRIEKSKMKCSGVYIEKGRYMRLADLLIQKRIRDWKYKLLANWYFRAFERILPKDTEVHLHIDKYKDALISGLGSINPLHRHRARRHGMNPMAPVNNNQPVSIFKGFGFICIQSDLKKVSLFGKGHTWILYP